MTKDGTTAFLSWKENTMVSMATCISCVIAMILIGIAVLIVTEGGNKW